MSWQPLQRASWDFKGLSEDQVVKRISKQIADVKKANGDPITGKQARKAAKDHYKSMEKEEVWINDIYQVAVNKHEHGDWIHLSIKRKDREQISDPARWQHFQWIKNQLVGEEHEGLELYPAESRIVNTANQYHLWVLDKIPFGFNKRIVSSADVMGKGKQTIETKGGSE